MNKIILEQLKRRISVQMIIILCISSTLLLFSFSQFALPAHASSNWNDSAKFVEIFKDDFENKNIEQWDMYDATGKKNTGYYEIVYKDGNFILSGKGHNWARAGDPSWKNYTFETKLMALAGDVHINVRLNIEGRYFVSFFPTGGRLVLFKQEELYGVPAKFTKDKWYTLRIEAFGNNIKVYVDNELMIDYTDINEPILSGNIGFETGDNSQYYFDNVRVLAPAQEVSSFESGTAAQTPIQTRTNAIDIVTPLPTPQPATSESGISWTLFGGAILAMLLIGAVVLQIRKPLEVLREYEYFNGFIRMKLSVKNKKQHTITDVSIDLELNESILRLDHYEPDTYTIKKEKIQLGNIAPNNDGTIALYLDPLICTKGTDIKCRIDYKDAYGRSERVEMEPLKIPIVCPVFQTEQDINIGRLKKLVDLLAHGSKVFSLSKGVGIEEAMTLCREIIQMHDVRHIRTFKTTDGKTAETWYYGKTKVEKNDIVIKASVSKGTESIEVFVAAPDQKALTGLLGELGRNLRERGESLGKLAPVVNLTIRGSIIQRSSLLSFCDMNAICGANVVIEDSLMQRSKIG